MLVLIGKEIMRKKNLTLKHLLLFAIIGIMIHCTQPIDDPEEKAIIETVNLFFKAINEQDSTIYKKIAFMEGQIWRMNNIEDPSNYDMRLFQDDVKTFDPQVEILEKPLSYDLKVHNGVATAWVPYKLWVNGKFSHCGVDTFILIKTNGGWKIVSTSYTKDINSCDELK